MESLTPMMKQYYEIKERFPEEILFFRMGDFYEMFGDDAEKASKMLEITLTKRNNILMCGIPYHAKDNYIHKIIKLGHKVAICDQLEDPTKAKGIVKRGVTEVITPGTLVDEHLLDQFGSHQNNFILSLYYLNPQESSKTNKKNKAILALAYADLSTGDFFLYEEQEEYLFQAVVDILYQISPKELILPESFKNDSRLINLLDKHYNSIPRNFIANYRFDPKQGEAILKDQLKVNTLKGFGIETKSLAISSAGSLLYYLKETQLREITHLRHIKLIEKNQSMVLNEVSLKNLELVKNNQDGSKHYTLFSILDQCKTKMGSRLLYQWILKPLLKLEAIQARQKSVNLFFHDTILLNESHIILSQIIDIERLIGRIALAKTNPRDFVSLKRSLEFAGEFKKLLSNYEDFAHYSEFFPDFDKVIQLIGRAIIEEPAIDFNSGQVIQSGYHIELDDLKDISRQGKEYLVRIQEQEKEKLKISNLRIKYNKVIGYFIEVSKGNTKNIPDYYIQKQTLTNVIRYTLPELSEYESKILGAEERISVLEREIFEEIRLVLCDYLEKLKVLSQSLAELDILSGFAHQALHHDYILPEVHLNDELIIKEGRHPVVEIHLKDEEFIANDLYLNQQNSKLQIITGPNMAGKSTYLRQAALLVIMAQIGSFIPAQNAKIPIVDKIFTRVGASDNLSRGESTFLVEMIETSQILHNASERSLIIMDEIGRGTSTYDGLSIAWSIVEYLSDPKNKMGKTLFATHYHELTALGKEKGIQNYQVMVREWGDEIIFLHKLIEGSGNKSYGIQVARLAGLPGEVISRSKTILADLENRNFEVEDDLLNQKHLKANQPITEPQLSLFPLPYDQLVSELFKIDVNLDPKIVVGKLSKLQDKFKKGEF